MNTQEAQLVDHEADYLSVHSVFPTIQGEGPYAGRRAIFVRLHGCNLKCPGCDTEYTSKKMAMMPADVLEMITPHALPHISNLVVITGGEPLRQDIRPLCLYLLVQGYTVQVESNGTVDLNMEPVYCFTRTDIEGAGVRFSITVSPKTAKLAPQCANYAKAYKYILDADHIDPADGLPSSSLDMKQRPCRPPFGFRYEDIYIQPFDQKDPHKAARNMEAVVQSALRFGYRISLQTHKILGLD